MPPRKNLPPYSDPNAQPDLSYIAGPLRLLAEPLEGILPDPENARTHDEDNLRAIVASLRQFGQRKPIVVNRTTKYIEAGNGTYDAARRISWTHLAVVWVEDDPASARGFSLADNRAAELADWDQLKLESLLAATADDSPELYSELLLAKLRADDPLGGLTDPDEVPDPPKKAITKSGDLWILGAHRLLCGDSTKAEDVGRLMGKTRAGLMNTDPPYGVALRLEDNHEASNAAKGTHKTYRHFEKIAGDELSGPKLQAFLEAAIRAALPKLRENAAFYLWHPMLTQGTFFAAAAAAAADILIHRQIIWAKPHFIFGRGDYHWQHELCFYGWRKGFRPPFYGERNQSTLWVLNEGGGAIRKDQKHPTQKPVALFVPPILNHTKRGESVYEPFAGSGTQFIAAEQHGRRCYGMEIDPAYCDVIVERWRQFTGSHPERHPAISHEITAAKRRRGSRQTENPAQTSQ
jgi:DNA modification methylase